jgi:uncharacterized protein (TIRG00374 family)
MVAPRRFALRTVALFLAVGLFVFLVYLYFFVPFGDVVQTIERVNPFYFLLAACALFISAAFYSLAWQRLLDMLSVKSSFLKTFQFTWVANFVDILVPAESVSGDISRIYLMSRESGGNTGKVAASVVCHRILATSVTIISLVISSIYFAVYYKPPLLILELVAIIATCSVIFIGLLLFLSVRKESTEKIVNWFIKLLVRISRGRWKFERLKESAMKTLSTFHEGIVTLSQNPKGLIQPLFFSILAWVSDIFIAVFVFLSLGPLETTISLSAIIIVYSISVAIHYIPIVSGELGILEIVMTSLFTLLGNPHAIAVFAVATVLIRVLTLWGRLFVGGLFVQFMGIKSLLPSQSSATEKRQSQAMINIKAIVPKFPEKHEVGNM